MFSAILALLIMPIADLSKIRGIQFRPLSKIAFFAFVANFLILMQLGAKHVESPFIELGQISTALYFAHFLIIVPIITLLENSLIDLAIKVEVQEDKYNKIINNIIIGVKRNIIMICLILLLTLIFNKNNISVPGLYGGTVFLTGIIVKSYFNKPTVKELVFMILFKYFGLARVFTI
jgi:ubiquinol-cytochrome c reductase cytochrome b subunit